MRRDSGWVPVDTKGSAAAVAPIPSEYAWGMSNAAVYGFWADLLVDSHAAVFQDHDWLEPYQPAGAKPDDGEWVAFFRTANTG